MKLKSKLIATIVSMCAAIAVMGVGVWASTSQSFKVTIKNDIDVVISNINADVYGEYAMYTDMNAAEDAVFAKSTGTGNGYLLYYLDEAGNSQYNDGVAGEYAGTGYDSATPPNSTSGLGKYLTEANNLGFVSEGQTGTANIDNDTHVAQIAYMYTIQQWVSEGSATNYINVAYTDNTVTADVQTKNAGVYADAYIQKKGDASWSTLTSGTAVQLDDNGDTAATYYILITYTFARNNASLDMNDIADKFGHTLSISAANAVTTAYDAGADAAVTQATAESETAYATGTAFAPTYVPTAINTTSNPAGATAITSNLSSAAGKGFLFVAGSTTMTKVIALAITRTTV